LPEAGINPAGRIAWTSRHIGLAFIKLATIRRVGEPDAAVGRGTTSLGELRRFPLNESAITVTEPSFS
jgi:hypothetical protein